jgi:hypothetical protein
MIKHSCSIARYTLAQLPVFEIHLSDRTTIADDVERYWVGRDSSDIGIEFLHADWSDRTIHVLPYTGRTDIFVIHFRLVHGGNNYFAFVEYNLSYFFGSYNPMDDPLFRNIRHALHDYIKNCIVYDYVDFHKKQVRWFSEQPWKQIDGKNPEEAVHILRQQGW